MCCVLTLALLASAQGTADIAWRKDLPTAFAEAKAQNKVLMICVNAKYVKGSSKIEPAAKGLREVVYRNARVAAKAREFVCVIFTPGATKEEFSGLRMLGIGGDIVSPQHIFVHPDGDRILLRKEYWSHGKGDAAVDALIAMMDEALKKLAGADAEPKDDKPLVNSNAPADAEGRAAWIAERVKEIGEGSVKACENAIDLLIRNDKDGDCLTPLLALLDEHEDKPDTLVLIIRGLGRNGLTAAAPALADFLKHKKEALRANAAVSLEYIGSDDKKVVSALLRAAGREKDESIANHMYRAAGRCGAGDSKVRSTLLKKADGAKSEFGSYGPIIGLAYFEGDAKTARGVEKILKKIGVPGGRRGAGSNTIKRSVLAWTLASIGDKKSAEFVREELLAKLENMQAFWVDPLRRFYKNVAKKCDGDASVMDSIEDGVRGVVSFTRGGENRWGGRVDPRNLIDGYRAGRDDPAFTPKGEYLLGRGS
jgi:hypothetical protein